MAELRAHNSKGFSDATNIVFKTIKGMLFFIIVIFLILNNCCFKDSPFPRPPDNRATLKANLGMTIFMIIGSIILMLLIMDIVSYVTCKVGLLYYLRTSLCGGKSGSPKQKMIPAGDE